ncbi:MAG: oligoribonuclease [Bifidobacterium aquikefiri]|uniref:oligoribonuclease n=1 Tax=Bifidobacterium aquikefiri TaxID=1653207 RepID=UPI0039EBCCDA
MGSKDDMTFSSEESRMIWIDCEMTGLDIFHDELCEVSVVPTDFDMNVLDEGIDLVIKPSDAALAQMNSFVRHMHTSSGLIEEMKRGLPLAEAQQQVIDYVKPFLPKHGKAHLGGNSGGYVKKFLARVMPNLLARLHFRGMHLPTVKELSRRWYPNVYLNKPAKHGGHRALADIIESMDELRYYRKMFFTPTPGASETEAKAGAEEIESTSLLRTFEEQGAPVEDIATPEKLDY